MIGLTIGAPQIIYLVMTLATLLVYARKHGQEKRPYDLAEGLLDAAFWSAILWWGGFFHG